MRHNIVGKTFHSAVQSQAVDRDGNRKDNQYRHHELAYFFNTLLYAAEYNESGNAYKEKKPSERFKGSADKI